MSESDLTMRELRELMGYVEDGSSQQVVLGQDDATKTYYVRVGNSTVYAPTLGEAIHIQWKTK